jgi:hypothetical protein
MNRKIFLPMLIIALAMLASSSAASARVWGYCADHWCGNNPYAQHFVPLYRPAPMCQFRQVVVYRDAWGRLCTRVHYFMRPCF